MNKLFTKFSLHLFLIPFFVGYLYSQEPSTKTKSTKSQFFFDITYKNIGTKSKHLIKVGIKSNVTGDFRCSSFGDVLLPIADYIVRFHVSNKETIIDADPPIEIKADSAARFTISYIPNATGACGMWSSEISGILIFDDGEKTYTNSEHITSYDLREFNRRTPEESEILSALKHRDSGLRIQAIKHLSKSTIDKQSIEFILKSKLDDQDKYVRVMAAKVASEMGFKSVAKKIALLLSTSNDGEEMAGYCEALGELRDVDTIDALVSALGNLKVAGFYPTYALEKFEHPDVIKKVRPLLLKNIRWTEIGASDDLASRYLNICEIVIKYRDMESIKALSDLINTPRHKIISWNVVTYIRSLIRENQIVQDPFILAMRPAFEKALKNPDWAIRFNSLSVLYQLPISDDILQGFLRNGLKDPEEKIRVLSAELVAKSGYKSLANEIILLLKSSKSESERQIYCEALKKLKEPCE